ncbi:MAG TPA: hypothetical protein VHO25_11610 [Polyangiaceae bacterium]|nr:hypothetical protein [Polyangiaceae bacterium]
MLLKLRPFSETFDRGSRHGALRIAGNVRNEMFVVDVDGVPVPLVTQRVEQGDEGPVAWLPSGQEIPLERGQLRLAEQMSGGELIGAELSVRFGPEAAASSSGFSVFFDVRGRVDGQGTVRGVSEPPVLN